MRKAIFTFIALIVVAASIDWIRSCQRERSDSELLKRELTFANMYEYHDKDFGFVIRYPSFFDDEPDSSPQENRHARFAYHGKWATVVLEGYVIYNRGQSLLTAMDSLAQALHATDHKRGDGYFILSGPQYENGSYIPDYSFYSKFVAHQKLWYVYTMVYPDRYKHVLTRLFHEIDMWQVWERPMPRLKQGESQTPRSVSE